MFVVKSTVDDLFSKMPEVKLIGSYKNPDTISAAGAYGCFEEKSSGQIYDSLKFTNEFPRSKKQERVFKNSIGNGHGSVADQAYFTYSIENLPRAATLQLCLPEYLSHLQQSLRRASADRGYYISKDTSMSDKMLKETKNVMADVFDFYAKAKEAGIPIEDARYPLPLATKTNIQTSGDVRELQHLHAMNSQGEVPDVVQYTVNEMIQLGNEYSPGLFKDRGKNYETLAWRPSSQLYSSGNELVNNLINDNYDSFARAGTLMIGHSSLTKKSPELVKRAIREKNETDLSALKHTHFEFLSPMSLASFHQATRQRTWNHSVESIYDAMERRDIVVPPSIFKSDMKEEYAELSRSIIGLYDELVDDGVPRSEAILYAPHSLEVTDLIHVDGWNAIHSIGKRRCTTAQWEIRLIADNMAMWIDKVDHAIGAYAEPQGYIYGACPERKNCGLCDKKLEKYPDGVNDQKKLMRSKMGIPLDLL
jgi:thymidylate synthase ThyX